MSLTNNTGACTFIGVNVHEKIKEKIEQDSTCIIGPIRKPTNPANQPNYVSNTPWLVDKWTHLGFCVVLVFNELEERDTNKGLTRGPYL